MANGVHFEKWKIGHRTISINEGLFVSKVELNATLSTSPISPNKTANIIKTKTGFSFSLL